MVPGVLWHLLGALEMRISLESPGKIYCQEDGEVKEASIGGSLLDETGVFRRFYIPKNSC